MRRAPPRLGFAAGGGRYHRRRRPPQIPGAHHRGLPAQGGAAGLHHRHQVGARRRRFPPRGAASLAALALAASPQPRKLRVGVFADGPLQPRWVVEALANPAPAEFADVRLVEVGKLLPASPSTPWRLYGALDRRLFGADPTQQVGLAEHLQIATLDTPLDVAFALGAVDETTLDGKARYGVWRFCFGADGAHGETFAGLREVAAAEPLTASGVKVRLAPNRPARLAYPSWARTHSFSVAPKPDQLLSKTAQFAFRALRELHRSGQARLPRLGGGPPR